MNLQNYVDTYLKETEEIVEQIDRNAIIAGAEILNEVKHRRGRLFILGVGGSAANASHAVNDFRKIGSIESYAPTDNVSELTARVNDESWESYFESWLRGSHLTENDALLVLSVGGGSQNASLNLVHAMQYAKQQGSGIISIVSRDGGFAKEASNVCILIPVVAEDRITPHAEGWQAVIWHLLVNAIQPKE